MTRLLDFHQSEESVLVSRVLLQVHKAIDHNFPNTRQPSRKFAKTLFSETDEPTHNKALPNTDIRPSQPHAIPPPPVTPSMLKASTKPLPPETHTQGAPAKAPPSPRHPVDRTAHTEELPLSHNAKRNAVTSKSQLSAHAPMTTAYRSLERTNKKKRLLLALCLALLVVIMFRYRSDLFLIMENLAHR